MRWPRGLRTRILLGIAALTTSAIVGGSLVSLALLRAQLDARTDERLVATAERVDRTIAARGGLRFSGQDVRILAPADAIILLYDTSGQLRFVLPEPVRGAEAAALEAALGAALGDAAAARVTGPVAAGVNGSPYHAVGLRPEGAVLTIAEAGEAAAIGEIVIAIPLEDNVATVRSLARIQTVVGAIALLCLGLLADRLLRRMLGPLGAMAETAWAVAAGEVDRRIEMKLPATEIEQLGTALNTAFDRRQEAEGRLRRFVADASHELRTPLTKIRGWADLSVQGGIAPADAERTMATIDTEASRMSALIDQLLALARMDEARTLDLAAVDMGALVHDVVEDARILHADHLISLTIDGGDSRAPIVATVDEPRLVQAIRNLVANAGRHTPAGTSIAVVVGRTTISRSAAAVSAVSISVHDDGPGIPADQQPRLFERFYRGADARAMGRVGAGLGLSIVEAVVAAHGGRVTVTSATGAGTTFRIVIPADGPDAVARDA